MPERDIIVIGGNAGASDPLQRIILSLPSNLPAAILSVMHLAPEGQLQLANIFKGPDVILTVLAEEGQPIRPGNFYLARPGFHLRIRSPGVINISDEPPENGFRPSMNVLFRSAAEVYGSRVVGILLSGLIVDGIEGLHSTKEKGGIVIVQKPEEALFPEMPESAQSEVNIDFRLTPGEIAEKIRELTGFE
jgi:two-component system chemotaxis response regulator CheB